jgi:hypothetical protein
MRFDELDLEDEVLDGIDAMNFQEMTPVQEQTIPIILDGRDIIACAQTGTGKTAAYTLPLLNRLLLEGNEKNVVKSVIIVPTRELAQQIDMQPVQQRQRIGSRLARTGLGAGDNIAPVQNDRNGLLLHRSHLLKIHGVDAVQHLVFQIEFVKSHTMRFLSFPIITLQTGGFFRPTLPATSPTRRRSPAPARNPRSGTRRDRRPPPYSATYVRKAAGRCAWKYLPPEFRTLCRHRGRCFVSV